MHVFGYLLGRLPQESRLRGCEPRSSGVFAPPTVLPSAVPTVDPDGQPLELYVLLQMQDGSHFDDSSFAISLGGYSSGEKLERLPGTSGKWQPLYTYIVLLVSWQAILRWR